METCPVCGYDYKILHRHLSAHYRRGEFEPRDVPKSSFNVYWYQGIMTPGLMTGDEERQDLIEYIGCEPHAVFESKWIPA